MTTFTPDYVVAEARKWLGTPYQHHGRRLGAACDCVGLIVGVGQAMDLNLYDRYDYSDHPTAEKLLTECAAVLDELPWRKDDGPVQLVAGMAVAMVVRAGIRPQHLAIIGEHEGRLTIIHAFNKHKRVVEHTLSPWWRDRIVRVYHYPGVIYEGAA